MIDEHIVRAIAEVAIFLELSGDDAIDADASVGALEQLAANLQQASADAREDLIAKFAAIAPSYPGHREFVAGLAGDFGLE